MLSHMAASAWAHAMDDGVSDNRVIVCTNSGKWITEAEYRSINQRFIKKIAIKQVPDDADTIYVTLKGPGENRTEWSNLVKSYSATMNINGIKCSYLKNELKTFTPRTSQYNFSDSCFYLTFELGSQFQTHGLMSSLSIFLITDSIPVVGQRYTIGSITVSDDNPIEDWTSVTGERAAVQVTCYPLCKDVLQEPFLTPENEDKRIILSSADLSGEIEIKKIEKIKKSDMYRMHLRLNADGVIRPKFLEGFEYPVRIKDADIRLGLVERADLRPCLFTIDYSWPDNYILAKQ